MVLPEIPASIAAVPELGKSEKNRRNLKLIQTCDFFMLVNFAENSIERTSACCEFFSKFLRKTSGASLIDG
nr:MAG TPA: hypothetical protein [Bacteriophage sp.]